MSTYNSWETLRGQPAFRMHSPLQVLAAAALGRVPAGLRALAASYYSLGRYGLSRAVWAAGALLAAAEWAAAYWALRQVLAFGPEGGWPALLPDWRGWLAHPGHMALALAPVAATLALGLWAWAGLFRVARQHRSRHGSYAPWPRMAVVSLVWGAAWWATMAGAVLFYR